MKKIYISPIIEIEEIEESLMLEHSVKDFQSRSESGNGGSIFKQDEGMNAGQINYDDANDLNPAKGSTDFEW